jgi:hypothetical protein
MIVYSLSSVVYFGLWTTYVFSIKTKELFLNEPKKPALSEKIAEILNEEPQPRREKLPIGKNNIMPILRAYFEVNHNK